MPVGVGLGMTYFDDLSEYSYSTGQHPPSLNVGWLEAGHAFAIAPPDERFLATLWEFCKVSVAQSRGVHTCTLCNSEESVLVRRNGEELLLGTSEILVFAANGGAIFSAPTLIFHYVQIHNYQPPIEFRRAVLEGPSPPREEYFQILARAGLEWKWTSKGSGPRFRLIRCP